MTKETAMATLETTTAATPLWFIHNLVRIHVDGAASGGALAVVEAVGARGDMPPLHVHTVEDETFYVLDGTLTLHVAGAEPVTLEAGRAIFAPRGVAHTYSVESGSARWLAICTPAGFDEFVREASDPAERDELPPADRAVDLARIGAAAARAGIELLGPPGALPS
jgi:quercetin dioxygenase-like cupin family protein